MPIAGVADVRKVQLLHDLRNCLFAIRNGLEILKAGCSDDERTAMVIQMMQAEESHATELLQEYEQQTLS